MAYLLKEILVTACVNFFGWQFLTVSENCTKFAPAYTMMLSQKRPTILNQIFTQHIVLKFRFSGNATKISKFVAFSQFLNFKAKFI